MAISFGFLFLCVCVCVPFFSFWKWKKKKPALSSVISRVLRLFFDPIYLVLPGLTIFFLRDFDAFFFFVGRIAPRFVRWTNRQKKKRLEGGRWRHFVISSSVFFCSSLFLFCSFSFLFVLFVSSSIYCALCAAPVCLPRPMGFSHSFSTLVVVVVLFYFILLFVMKIYGFGFMERNLLRDVDSLQPIVNDSMNQIELSHFSPCKKKR